MTELELMLKYPPGTVFTDGFGGLTYVVMGVEVNSNGANLLKARHITDHKGINPRYYNDPYMRARAIILPIKESP